MNEETVKKLKTQIIAEIDVTREISDDEVIEIIDRFIRNSVRHDYLNIETRLLLRKNIFNSIRRLDVLQDLIEDKSITEIMVNGADKIFCEIDGKLFLTDKHFETERKLEDIIQRIASEVNRTVNEAHPIVDARLSDGSRVNIVLPPVSLNGPILTIRKFSKDILSVENLVELGSLSHEAAEFLKLLIKGHYNIICSGGTGCGKTTLLNALAEAIPKTERVIVIEDSAELIMDSLPNLVRMETRNANSEGKNEITIRDLIKTSLRMRPDRLVVGEVRGREAIDMLQSLNTGHCGISTIHANSPADMIARLETMVLLDENIPLHAVRAQISSAVDIIVGISRMRDSSRKITEICEVDGMEKGEIKLNKLFEFRENDYEAETTRSGASHMGMPLWGSLVKVGNLKHRQKLKMYGLESDVATNRSENAQ